MAFSYSEKVMEHFANPHNVGELEDANGIGEIGNAKCGDIMKMYIRVNEDEIIEDVKFKTYGCASAIATSSMATDLIKGAPLSEALRLTNQAVVEALDGLPAVKIHCSVLAEQMTDFKTLAFSEKGRFFRCQGFAAVLCFDLLVFPKRL